MAARRLDWSRRAERDYLSALAYLAEVAGASIALKVVNRTESALAMILAQPAIGTPGRRAGTREFPVPHTGHTLIYRLTGSRITVIRYWHQRREP